ncbi:hypothetical protein VTL71DRAFT_15207 [Oculimacula yallundae]|uniref:Elongin-C n=1 Tax=Oculimacula yallundae TaxID=86028 RepID=A0ABR4CI84_9HELO
MASSTQKQDLSKYVTLVSSDGFEFVVLREAACHSGAIRKMLDPKSNFKESSEGRCVFEEIKYVGSTFTCDLYLPIVVTIREPQSPEHYNPPRGLERNILYLRDMTGSSSL